MAKVHSDLSFPFSVHGGGDPSVIERVYYDDLVPSSFSHHILSSLHGKNFLERVNMHANKPYYRC